MKKSPVVGQNVPINKPKLANIPDQHRWSFSFQYFQQIEFFGLGDLGGNWFVSLLEKLRDLSKMSIDSFIKDRVTTNRHRYHRINWEATNIPIQRKDVSWVDRRYLDNEDEYPFVQFQISKALGRVIGFWDETHQHFYIVLLDPKHNMQPSKDYEYKVDETSIEHCEFLSLLADIDRIKGIKCTDENCVCKAKLNELPTNLNRGRFVYFQLDDEYYDDFLEKTQSKSVKQIIELGLLSH
ncbi:hypothetical protein SAMN04487996_107152 [Dyadobacter soli]|uniref:Uncharacterized protein n=1 Tax=Dyadobacter soli TaxID=659014 RepID=A0A1G7G7A3_9BACT|nr:hypothetical protein [Dyadobacter soli]SDE84028.1 hypothetical protein SAMN04487996_107152 [Dyadobacter soli]